MPSTATATPPGATTAILIVALICAYNFFRGQKIRAASAGKTAKARLERPAAGFGLSLLCWQLISAAYLTFEYHRGGWTPASVRFTAGAPTWAAVACGAALYLPFLWLLETALRLAGRFEVADAKNLRLMAFLWPRERGQKRYALFAIAVLNPITEEILFRGILVAQLALVVHSWPLAIAAGLLGTVANHAYQGALAQTTHIPMYLLFVLLLLSPLGLAGAIGCHFVADVYPVLTLRRDARRYFRQARMTAVGLEA